MRQQSAYNGIFVVINLNIIYEAVKYRFGSITDNKTLIRYAADFMSNTNNFHWYKFASVLPKVPSVGFQPILYEVHTIAKIIFGIRPYKSNTE